MADTHRSAVGERDIEQAITALKRGSCLLKYGRRGKPKFCPFRISNDESLLIWYSGKEEKQLKLNQVSKIIPGQRTATFQRYPRPEKEYQSFSLICTDRSLDLICKDKEEAEVWFVGLKALITRGPYQRLKCSSKSECVVSASPNYPSTSPSDPRESESLPFENISHIRLGKAFCDIISYTAVSRSPSLPRSVATSSLSSASGSEAFRISLSSCVSSSSQGSSREEFDALGDVFIWGEAIGDGILGGGMHRVGNSPLLKMDALLPKVMESTVVLDVQNMACGDRHAALVTRQGEIFSWGEESGGRLGHGVDTDVSHPKSIDYLSGKNIESVACGEYHTCAVTISGDLYTWGDGTCSFAMLGHGSDVSHCMPKKVGGPLDGTLVSYVSCGPWHTAVVASSGQLFTFGDGSFGALGHGDHYSATIPREVEALKGLRTTRVACGVWHSAAVVEVPTESSSTEPSEDPQTGKLFTWGDGDKGQLGHGDNDSKLIPECVAALGNENMCRVACGHNLTVALTTSGKVYTMGSTTYGQLGCPSADGKAPANVEGKIRNNFVEDIACGSYHVAVLTTKTEVYTWGKGSNGQLGHGDNGHKNTPTLVQFLKDKQAKSVFCGSNFTAAICLHKWASSADHSLCAGCQNPFGFIRRKRHNCYNCGLVFCNTCSSKKSQRASLSPNAQKPYRVCDDCYSKINNGMDSSSLLQNPSVKIGTQKRFNEVVERESKVNKLRATLSRLSSFGSPVQPESRLPKIRESHDTRVFPAVNGKLHLGVLSSSKVSDSLVGQPLKIHSVSVHATRIASRSISPTSTKSSPRQSSDYIFYDSRLRNDMLNQEIVTLKSQVETLVQKSQHLEAELLRTTKQLKEVTAIATDETEKCKSAKGVIMSLTAQLKEMAQRLPEGHNASADCFTGGHTVDTVNQSSNETESNSTGSRIISNGTKGQNGRTEWIVQDETGVYITLSSLPGGCIELKRVRFSRRHFTEEQAEKWWAENGTKVCERHNIVAS